MQIQPAIVEDIPQLVSLLNSAYRGEVSKKGWTTEANLLQGDKRTDETSLKELMQTKGTIFLKSTNADNIIEGSVLLQKNENRLYLGMLSVSPELQAKGIGKQLMTAATAYAKEQGCTTIYMRVISLRNELINWYEKLGYTKTGVTEPFPTDNRFGIPTQPLEFLIMEKQI